MAQDGNWQEEPAAEKKGRVAELREQHETQYRRQLALEQATKITTAVLAANGTLENTLGLADRFARWMETGQLPGQSQPA